MSSSTSSVSSSSASLRTSFSSLSLSEQQQATPMEIDEKAVTVQKGLKLDKMLQGYLKALQLYIRTGDSKGACKEYSISETTFQYGLIRSRLPNDAGIDETRFLKACNRNIRLAVKK